MNKNRDNLQNNIFYTIGNVTSKLIELQEEFKRIRNSNSPKTAYIFHDLAEIMPSELDEIAKTLKFKGNKYHKRVLAALTCALFKDRNQEIFIESWLQEYVYGFMSPIYYPYISKLDKYQIITKKGFKLRLPALSGTIIALGRYNVNTLIMENISMGKEPYFGVGDAELPFISDFVKALDILLFDTSMFALQKYCIPIYHVWKSYNFSDDFNDAINPRLSTFLKDFDVKALEHLSSTSSRPDEIFADLITFCLWVSGCLNSSLSHVNPYQVYNRIYTNTVTQIKKMEPVLDGSHPLLRRNIFEYDAIDTPIDTTLRLTEYGAKVLFGKYAGVLLGEKDRSDLILSKNIKKKKLFYNTENLADIKTLSSFLMPKKFKEIRDRMQEKGLQGGLSVLLYGPPGTGKTETVFQFAKKAHLDVLKVDISQIRDKWVGESEKNVKAIFQRYKTICSPNYIPILFLNEADGLISNRTTSRVENASVAKMENTMQDILLDELENFKGILIATTNMIDNMDEAFERRFLYKVRLDNPTKEVRKNIWKDQIDLPEDILDYVASEYEFSGGQIQNIVRKINIDEILFGQTLDMKAMKRYCDTEKWSDTPVKKIGF